MKLITSIIKNIYTRGTELYVHSNLFYIGGSAALLMALSFSFEFLWTISLMLLALAGLTFLIQFVLLFFTRIKVTAERILPEILSLGENQRIGLKITNESPLKLNITLTEALPYQLGIRNSTHTLTLLSQSTKEIEYSIRPTARGVYTFGNNYIFVQTFFPLLERRLTQRCNEKVDVYPSIIQMKKFELYASKRLSNDEGVKKTRRLGHGSEFEQIKQYIPGDDPRTINWKASARTGHIMTNHYQEESSQPVYQILDTSRSMKMPFNGLTLLDHSINTALALSNIILKKSDKAGLISFDKHVNTFLEANNSSYQLKSMLKSLYAQNESSNEANYELLFYSTRKHLTKRSLCILYTNFESIYALQRVMAQLLAISKRHLLLVVIFENTELTDFSKKPAKNIYDIYDQTLAKKVSREKSLIHAELDRHGILNISVTTETLTADVINKYLEVKSRGAL